MLLVIEKRMKEEKGFIFNVDFFSVIVFYSMNILYDLFILIFVVSCIFGWIVYILE